MNVYEESLKIHEELRGKLDINLKCKVENRDDLSLAYTPGVAEPCKKININEDDAYKYTWKGNTIAVVTNGTAVLGLGDIGAIAGMPVMEGKCVLFKKFAGVNAVPLLVDSKDPKEIINVVKTVAKTYGGINLEDIKAPECVEIERALIEELDIPVFHDDQHGTAIVVSAALINYFRLTGKKAEESIAVISGAGAAGYSIAKMIKDLGIKNIYAFDSKGILCSKNKDSYNFVKQELLEITNNDDEDLTMADAMAKSNIFIGVSGPGVIDADMVKSMGKDSIVLAMANPEPEINFHTAKEAGARIVGTGRSDFPNQINNVLAFPGLFKGALNVHATKITEEMKMAAAEGIASLIEDKDLSEDKIIPSIFDEGVSDVVADAVAACAIKLGLTREL